ncbi:PREDICTED: heavy metal-associated isoprenylated plant protein 3-like [Tarenaya hassleriana]|uniref:heavy metal-associated isoprenylated plant protein 3-like n=1 Tax=Tarenaya hassleriana TaxID=28532 RepID=UPI00053C1BDC|nr:PREDICTED: heavy metal-associated isoprenylated plant protein 3-like [Tarenaya hassleriana]
MGEEEKKMEEKKSEEGEESGKKPEEKSPEKDPKEEEKKPQEIVLKIYMHCEGCAKKVRRCLKGFEGVDDVMTDCRTSKVIVKGDKADPLKVLERLQRKSNRQVELLSPIPEPKPAEEPKEKSTGDEKPKAEEKKDEVVTVVLRVHMHCEACAMEIQKRIMRMKGVESAEPDYKASQVSVRGVFSPAKLVEDIYRRTGKHAAVVKQDPPPEKDKETKEKEDEKKKTDGKKQEETTKQEDQAKDSSDGGGEAKPAAEGGGSTAEEAGKVVETKRNEYYYSYHPPRYTMENMHAYPPQIFSDENPNACTLM